MFSMYEKQGKVVGFSFPTSFIFLSQNIQIFSIVTPIQIFYMHTHIYIVNYSLKVRNLGIMMEGDG